MVLHTQSVEVALERVTKTYGRAMAVDDLSLTIGAGEMVALLGPSGCGKTTSLRMIAGLITPTSGDIRVGGRSITGLPVHLRNIGMLFQNYALFPHMTVFENVSFGLDMRGVDRAQRRKRVEEALGLVQLGGFAERLPQALSGGQQQRVALARAIVIEPSVLLLDEPLGALDKGLRESMQVELRQLQQRLGITTVIVTHDQEEALTLADRIVVMRDGRVEQFGTPEEIYARPSSRFVASFIGASNFFEGRVTGRDGGRTHLVTAGGVRLLVPDLVTEETATVLARPEVVHVETLAGDGQGEPNTSSGIVEQRIYRGSVVHLYLRLDDGTTLLAYHPPTNQEADLLPGARVLASWPEAKMHVVDRA